jgi:hypothetical protein
MDIELQHEGVEVTIMDGQYLVDGKPTPTAVQEYQAIIARLDELRRFAADRLLALYNDKWQDEEIGPVDADGFVMRLANPSVLLFDQVGTALVWLEDSGLFAGHHIEVSLDNGIPSQATLSG